MAREGLECVGVGERVGGEGVSGGEREREREGEREGEEAE